MFSAYVHDAIMAAFGPSEEAEELVIGDSEDDIEEVWEGSDMPRDNEHSTSPLKQVKSLCRSISLHVPTTVVAD